MALDSCQQETVLKWLQDRELPRHCPCCGSEGEFMGCDVVELHIKELGARPTGTEIPVVPIICQNCGHVRLFSANLMGI
jgi:hypothetical protein